MIKYPLIHTELINSFKRFIKKSSKTADTSLLDKGICPNCRKSFKSDGEEYCNVGFINTHIPKENQNLVYIYCLCDKCSSNPKIDTHKIKNNIERYINEKKI